MINIPEIGPVLLARFAALTMNEKQSIIAENPRPEFAEEAIALYEQASSYRGAEFLGRGVILTMVSNFSGPQLVRIIHAARNNGEIWDAAGSPEILLRLFDLSIARLDQTKDAWSAFIDHVSSAGRADSYEPLRRRVASAGPPSPP